MSPLTAPTLFANHIDRTVHGNSCWPERIVPSVSFWKVLSDDLTQAVREAAFPEYQYPNSTLRDGHKVGVESQASIETFKSSVGQNT